METSGSTAPVSSPTPLTRASSGFVREIGTSSSIAVNLMTMSLALGVLAVTQVPFAFPGASTVLTTIIAGIAVAFPVLLYALLAAIMPRSGGDYVYVSRAIHPWLGFAVSVNATIWYAIFAADLAFLVPQFGLSTAFANLASTTGSGTLSTWSLDVLKDGWTFAIAAAVLIVITLVVSLNVRRMLTVVKVLFVFSVVGVVVAIVILLFNDRGDFINAVANNGGNYTKVIADAKAEGYSGGGFDLGNSLLAVPILFTSFGYAIATAFVGGEVKSPVRDIRGKFYAYGLGVGLVLLTAIFASVVFGNQFLGSAAYLSNNYSENFPFAAPANYFYFVGLLTHSSVLVAIMGFSFAAGILALLVPTFLFVTRPLFAWSFDRLIPEKISEVNERTRSPIIANVLALMVGLAYLVLIVFGSQTFTSILATIVLGTVITFALVALSAALLPFRRPDLYTSSPVGRRVKPAVFSLIATISFAVYTFIAVVLFTNDALGANSSTGRITILVILVISVIAYPISYAFNKRRGIDLTLVAKELPAE
jgi:APA family basic amino acid/polyamine antiporter